MRNLTWRTCSAFLLTMIFAISPIKAQQISLQGAWQFKIDEQGYITSLNGRQFKGE